MLFVVYEKMEKRKRELEPGMYRERNYVMNCIMCDWADLFVLCLIQEICFRRRRWKMVLLKKRGNILSLQLIRYLYAWL